MKKFAFILILLVLAFCAFASTNLFNFAANNGTNASNVATISNIYVPGASLSIQFGAITNVIANATNAAQVDHQFSIDPANTNWITDFTVIARVTNGEYRVIQLPNFTTNLQQRVLIRTSNSLSIGVWLN